MKSNLRAFAVFAALAICIVAVGTAFDLHPVTTQVAAASDFAMAMSVVTKYGTGARNPAVLSATDAIFAEAAAKTICSQISITNGDSIASTFAIGSVPADAIIDPNSAYDYEAVASVSDFDVGFRYPNGGAVIDADALVDGDDISSAGAQTLKGHATLTTANGMKRAWELAGLSSNPGGMLEIYATLNAASTATKVVNFFIRYFKRV